MNNLYDTAHTIRSTWRTRWTITPSSSFLVDRMISKIDYSSDIVILQLWFGNGVFTKQLISRISDNSSIIIFEIDPNCRQYCIDDDRITYIEDSAENISHYYQDQSFDYVLSTLPFASLPRSIVNNIFVEIKKQLKKWWMFLQFQYFLSSIWEIENLFHTPVNIDFEIRNIPPAFILQTSK